MVGEYTIDLDQERDTGESMICVVNFKLDSSGILSNSYDNIHNCGEIVYKIVFAHPRTRDFSPNSSSPLPSPHPLSPTNVIITQKNHSCLSCDSDIDQHNIVIESDNHHVYQKEHPNTTNLLTLSKSTVVSMSRPYLQSQQSLYYPVITCISSFIHSFIDPTKPSLHISPRRRCLSNHLYPIIPSKHNYSCFL